MYSSSIIFLFFSFQHIPKERVKIRRNCGKSSGLAALCLPTPWFITTKRHLLGICYCLFLFYPQPHFRHPYFCIKEKIRENSYSRQGQSLVTFIYIHTQYWCVCPYCKCTISVSYICMVFHGPTIILLHLKKDQRSKENIYFFVVARSKFVWLLQFYFSFDDSIVSYCIR